MLHLSTCFIYDHISLAVSLLIAFNLNFNNLNLIDSPLYIVYTVACYNMPISSNITLVWWWSCKSSVTISGIDAIPYHNDQKVSHYVPDQSMLKTLMGFITLDYYLQSMIRGYIWVCSTSYWWDGVEWTFGRIICLYDRNVMDMDMRGCEKF